MIRCLLKGAFWTFLTTVSGFLGVIAHGTLVLFSRRAVLDLKSLALNGTLFLFAATLAAAVAIDNQFERKRKESAASALDTMINASSATVVAYSTLCYQSLMTTPPADIDVSWVVQASIALFATALTISVAAKSISFGTHSEDIAHG